jgi:hypothetical protein
MRITQLCTRTLCLLAALSFLAAPAARAAFIVNVDPVGSDVVMTGSGTLNTAALNHLDIGGVVADVHASTGELIMGPTSNTFVNVLDPISGPSNFGSGGSFAASSGSGNLEGVSGNVLLVSSTSGALSNTDTYSGKTLASLGLTVGTYVWTWGSGANADSFTINVNPVPEPASLGLIALAGLALLRRR